MSKQKKEEQLPTPTLLAYASHGPNMCFLLPLHPSKSCLGHSELRFGISSYRFGSKPPPPPFGAWFRHVLLRRTPRGPIPYFCRTVPLFLGSKAQERGSKRGPGFLAGPYPQLNTYPFGDDI